MGKAVVRGATDMIVGGDARGVCTRGEPLVGCEESVDSTVVLLCA